MIETSTFERCLRLVDSLNREYQWNLSLQTRHYYAQTVAHYVAEKASLHDGQISSILRNYHTEHVLVLILSDPTHPDHDACWDFWKQQARRILLSKTAQFYHTGDLVVGLEDLVQEALLDLWRGLSTFRYSSQFRTWAFTIIFNCLKRHVRERYTKKRGANTPVQSLEALALGDAMPCDETQLEPDQVAAERALTRLSLEVLRAQPDQRLAKIFYLWSTEDQTLQLIGAHFKLSPARVHTLLQEAIALIRCELIRQSWRETDTPAPTLPISPFRAVASAAAYPDPPAFPLWSNDAPAHKQKETTA